MNQLVELPIEFQVGWYGWVLAFLAAFIIGLVKSGLKGVVVIVVTLFALVFGGKASTGIILILFIVMDIVAVIYYNRHTQWKYLRQLLPWMIAGILLGVWVGNGLNETVFQQVMVGIIFISLGIMFWWESKPNRKVPQHWGFGGIMGLAAGFTTMIGNLAGAFSNIFFLAMRSPKNEFIGTVAWLFFIINLFKLPFHVFVWETISLATLAVDLRLIIAPFLGFFIGIRVVKKIKNASFRKMILVLTSIGAVIILLKSFGFFQSMG